MQLREYNPYLETLEIEDAVAKDPKRWGLILRLCQRTGLPPLLVDQHFEDIKKRAETEDTDFAKMLREAPQIQD